ncbi:MAG: hypothetical protein ACKO14_01310 [Armatimonadota bacterium]
MSDRDFSTRLAAEVKQWVLDGIIAPDTADRVVSRYPFAPDTRHSCAGVNSGTQVGDVSFVTRERADTYCRAQHSTIAHSASG